MTCIVEALEPRRLLAGVTGLFLVNADTGEDLMPLRGRITLNLAMFPTRNLTVRADATGDTTAVRFGLDRNRAARTDTDAPFTLAGDDSGVTTTGLPPAGVHTLSATGLRLVRGKLRSGSARSVKLTIIDPPVVDANGAGPRGDAWSRVFADEFSGAALASTWTGTLWGLHEIRGLAQVYDPSAVRVADGVLTLEARRDGAISSDRDYVSGQLNTGAVSGPANFALQYGYVEARLKVPAGQGLWPAFWMLPTRDGRDRLRDGQGEIDVMEFIGSQPNTVEVHARRRGREWGDGVDAEVDLSEGFHTYGVAWQANHLTWYLDGKAIFSVTDPAAIPKVPMYLILNLAVGTSGSWPGAPDESTSFPAEMQVDWVRAWRE